MSAGPPDGTVDLPVRMRVRVANANENALAVSKLMDTGHDVLFSNTLGCRTLAPGSEVSYRDPYTIPFQSHGDRFSLPFKQRQPAAVPEESLVAPVQEDEEDYAMHRSEFLFQWQRQPEMPRQTVRLRKSSAMCVRSSC